MKAHLKSLLLCLLAALLGLGLCACAAAGGSLYSATVDGRTFQVDTAAGTLSEGEDRYSYTLTETAAGAQRLEFRYPNGALWWREEQDGSFTSGYQGDYDESRYAAGPLLAVVLDAGTAGAARQGHKSLVLPIVLLALGAFYLIAPGKAWKLEGWKQAVTGDKAPAPHKTALLVNRILGGVFLAAGVLLLLL